MPLSELIPFELLNTCYIMLTYYKVTSIVNTFSTPYPPPRSKGIDHDFPAVRYRLRVIYCRPASLAHELKWPELYNVGIISSQEQRKLRLSRL